MVNVEREFTNIFENMEDNLVVYFNGKWLPWREANKHVMDHTSHYGGGIFEGIRTYRGSDGSALVFRLYDHVARLMYSCDVMGIRLQESLEEIVGIIEELLRRNNLSVAYIRPLISYGYGGMGLYPKPPYPIDMVFMAFPFGKYIADEKPSLMISSIRRGSSESMPNDVKISGHYSRAIRASIEAKELGFSEALMLDPHGFIAEGSGENFFMVKQNKKDPTRAVIYTPFPTYILPGFTRESIMSIAFREMGYRVYQKNITVEEAKDADEVFLTGTAAELTWIHAIDKTIISEKSGPVTRAITDFYEALVNGRVEKYFRWIHKVEIPQKVRI